MNDELRSIELSLRQAMNLSQQGTYHRRDPSGRSVPILSDVRQRLRSWMERHSATQEVLRLLALAEEALLNYDAAAEALQKAISLGERPNKKDLKRLAAYRAAGQMWKDLRLSPEELVELGKYLKMRLLDTAPERSLYWTEQWLDEAKPGQQPVIIAEFQKLGCVSDYQILHNLIPG